MNKRFNDFLNENTSKKFQHEIDKEDYSNFENDVKEKSSNLGINVNIHKTSGVSKIKILLSFDGDMKSINEIMEWIKKEY